MLLATKLIEKISNPHTGKEHYQSFLGNKNRKSAKQWKIITYQPNTFENPNIVPTRSAIIEHPKTSHKIFQTIRETEKVSQVGSNSSLYIDTKKKWKCFERKKCKNNNTSTYHDSTSFSAWKGKK